MKENKKDFKELEYEFDGCGDYDKDVEYSEQSKMELKEIMDIKNKILKEMKKK